MAFYQDKGLAICGLACVLCSEADCPGCQQRSCKNSDTCTIFQCAGRKGFVGCWQCGEFPCGEGMFQNMRIRAFTRYAREHGIDALLSCLRRNAGAGIVYHRNGLKGDYDEPETEEGIIQLIERGRG